VYPDARVTNVAIAGLLPMLYLPAYISRAVGTEWRLSGEPSGIRRQIDRAAKEIASSALFSGGVCRRQEAELVEMVE
jgi:hypothetical protein